jgi:uncharacterized membrane protein
VEVIMDHTLDRAQVGVATPGVRRVAPTQPLEWLRRGWSDLRRAARPSLTYGLLIAAFGVGLLIVSWGATYLVPALVGGFLLVAPFAAIVFYALSQQIERGAAVDGAAALFAWRRNGASIALWGLALVLTLILWERLTAIIFALFYGGQVGDLGTLVADVLFSGRYIPLLIAYFGVGGLLALTVFALGVVTAPMLLDREIDVVTAAVTSVRCCMRNPGAALLWAVLIAALTAVGFATLMIGLVVVFPWLGHASWHAYRDLVE